MSRQFCTKTKFHIQKKEVRNRRQFVSSDCSKIVVEKSACLAATGMQRGCSKRVPLRYYARNHAWQKAFTLPHRGENGPSLSTIHMSTSHVSSLQNVWHVLSFSRGFKRSSNPRNDRHQRPETIKEKYKAILCAPDASSPSSKRNYESFIYENFT